MKVQPCVSSILWQSDTRSPRKTSPCFPDNTQFSYSSRFWGVGGISQNTWKHKHISNTHSAFCTSQHEVTLELFAEEKSFKMPPLILDWTFLHHLLISYLSVLQHRWTACTCLFLNPPEAPPCFLSVCGTTLMSLRSQCESPCSSPRHSSDSICRVTPTSGTSTFKSQLD